MGGTSAMGTLLWDRGLVRERRAMGGSGARAAIGQLIVMLLPLPPPRGHLGHSISSNFTFF